MDLWKTPQVQQQSLKSLQPQNLREFIVWQRESKETIHYLRGRKDKAQQTKGFLGFFRAPEAGSSSSSRTGQHWQGTAVLPH